MLSESMSFKSTKVPLQILFTNLAGTGGRADDRTRGQVSLELLDVSSGIFMCVESRRAQVKLTGAVLDEATIPAENSGTPASDARDGYSRWKVGGYHIEI